MPSADNSARSASAFGDFALRFARNRAAVLAGAFVLVCVVAALLAPILLGDPKAMQLEGAQIGRPPSLQYPLGSDLVGRGVFTRLVWGARVSLMVGISAALLSATVGIVVGSVSGYYGGRLDDVLMRVVELFIMIPRFFLILLISAFFGTNIWYMMLIIGLTIWPSTARLVRAEFLSLRERDFVVSERAMGATDARIAIRHLLPNTVHVVVVNTSLQVAMAVLLEASLSFLGLGDPNQVTWGQMLHEAIPHMRRAWWLAVFPGLAITLMVLSLNLVGDAVNDALNPRLNQSWKFEGA